MRNEYERGKPVSRVSVDQHVWTSRGRGGRGVGRSAVLQVGGGHKGPDAVVGELTGGTDTESRH